MFETIVKSKLKTVINEKMVDNKLILTEKEILDLINKYTDYEFNISLFPKEYENSIVLGKK